MIWKLAMPYPKVIAVSVQIKSCNTTKGSENHGCDGYKDISFATSAVVDNQFGMVMACKESRYIGLQALPRSTPTAYSQLAGIRYNPDDTKTRENFTNILFSFEFGNRPYGNRKEDPILIAVKDSKLLWFQ
jgi:hypothetical protein